MSNSQRLPTRQRRFQFRLRTFLALCLTLGFGFGIGSAYIKSIAHVVTRVECLENSGLVIHSNFMERYGLFPFDRREMWQSVFEWSLSDPDEAAANPTQTVRISDVLKHLATLPTLRNLDLTSTDVTSDDLRLLAPLRKLEQLDLKSTLVDDAGMIALAALPALRKLNLSATNITDEGLTAIAQMGSLELLDLYGTKVSKEGLERFRSARPDITIGDSILAPADLMTVRIGAAG